MPEEIPPPPWRRPKKAPPRVPLTQDRIVVTALGILDAEGLDALSMRRLAQELKTGHASLYAHVGNRDELLDLVFDIVLTEVEVPEPEPGRWAEQVKEMCRSLRRMFLAHRDLARIAIDRVPLGPNGMVGMERTMNLLRSGGLHDELAAYGGDLLSTFVTAEALEQSSRNPGTEQGREQAGVFADQLHGYLEVTAGHQFPEPGPPGRPDHLARLRPPVRARPRDHHRRPAGRGRRGRGRPGQDGRIAPRGVMNTAFGGPMSPGSELSASRSSAERGSAPKFSR